MNFLEHAKKLAHLGFEVFPLAVGGKLPAITDFPEVASTDPAQLDRWWIDDVMERVQPLNVGISTSRFKGGALLVIDVDVKKGKDGNATLFELELEGKTLPPTLTQKTPTGGMHIIYSVSAPIKQGVDVLGSGLDVRSKGGYIVGAGSVVEAGEYTIDIKRIQPAPQWVIDACTAKTSEPPTKLVSTKIIAGPIDQKLALERAIYYLANRAPLSIEGAGGDETAFKVACTLKDMGLSKIDTLDLMLTHWNDRCSPPWDDSAIERKIINAYAYGQAGIGADAPEMQFEKIVVEESTDTNEVHPFEILNREYAFVLTGGGYHILWETKGEQGEDRLVHLSELAFHKKLAHFTMRLGNNRSYPVSELWIRDPKRRSYDGICFWPGREAPSNFYNLWRGFSVELPSGEATPEALSAVEMFYEHALKNVCNGEQKLYDWLMGYFAHLVQRPGEKPLTAVVFRGGKGVGKNALIDQIAAMMRSHALVTSNRRYLAGNFNSHLENLLLFVLDEAFWSGDKQTEGVLKDLITGHHHFIEHKGKESYKVDNCTRVVIIGNEEWVVPASEDERRYAVFTVGNGRKQDRSFFTTMRKGMDAGGRALLFKALMEYDLSTVDVNDAPKTAGLLAQKLETMSPFHQWLFASLHEDRIIGYDIAETWPPEIEREQLRQAMVGYMRERNIRSRAPDARKFGVLVNAAFPKMKSGRKSGTHRAYTYVLPTLEDARKSFEKFLGQGIDWEISDAQEQLKKLIE